MPPDPLLQLDRVVLPGRRQRRAEIDLGLAARECLVLLGPEGAGKRALLSVVNGFKRPGGGRVLLGGCDLADVAAEQRRIAYLPAADTLLSHMTLAANVALGPALRGLPRADQRARARTAMSRVGLSGSGGYHPRRCSAHERHLAQLARALAIDPLLLTCEADDLLPDLARAGIASVTATRDPISALAHAHRIAIMRDHAIVQLGTPVEVFEQPADAFVARYVGACNIIDTGTERLAVRPHRMRVDPAGPLAGKVAAVAYQGALTRLTVAIDGAREALLADLADPPRDLVPGRALRLAWDPAHAWPLPPEP